MEFHFETGKHVKFPSELKGRVTFFRSRDTLFFTLRGRKSGEKRYINCVCETRKRFKFHFETRGGGISKRILTLRGRVPEISLRDHGVR
jgi:hypothetical protein